MIEKPKIKVINYRDLKLNDLKNLFQRSKLNIENIRKNIEEIILDVKNRGDVAIFEFYENFYKKRIIDENNIKVKKEEIDAAYKNINREFIDAIEVAHRNIKMFHEMQKPKNIWFIEVSEGAWVGQIVRPFESIGVYIPGGKASYPTTALMSIIPAKIAGVKEIIALTPPRDDGSVDPYVLVTLDYLGVKEIFKVGGAHAVAAMAFGTNSIPKVEKIYGPGGVWFTAAKQIIKLYSDVEIDFIAGPSEILILADETADPFTVVYDLISQLEHDPLSAGIIVTTSKEFAQKVKNVIEDLVPSVPRNEIIKEAIESYSAIIVTESIDEAIDFINRYAPEHLEIQVREDLLFEILSRIKNAGSIFLGKYSTVTLGDYIIGSNHILPTGGLAKYRGGLGVLDYLKIIDVIYVTNPKVLTNFDKYIKILTEVEGLYNHYQAIKYRIIKEEK